MPSFFNSSTLSLALLSFMILFWEMLIILKGENFSLYFTIMFRHYSVSWLFETFKLDVLPNKSNMARKPLSVRQFLFNFNPLIFLYLRTSFTYLYAFSSFKLHWDKSSTYLRSCFKNYDIIKSGFRISATSVVKRYFLIFYRLCRRQEFWNCYSICSLWVFFSDSWYQDL